MHLSQIHPWVSRHVLGLHDSMSEDAQFGLGPWCILSGDFSLPPGIRTIQPNFLRNENGSERGLSFTCREVCNRSNHEQNSFPKGLQKRVCRMYVKDVLKASLQNSHSPVLNNHHLQMARKWNCAGWVLLPPTIWRCLETDDSIFRR